MSNVVDFEKYRQRNFDRVMSEQAKSKGIVISDDALEATCYRKLQELGFGAGARLRTVRNKFTGNITTPARAIPQNRRTEFLREIEALQPDAT